MPRYFIEVAYNGKRYAGFQKQSNANTIQAEVEKALGIYFKASFNLTGSSRTDAGVHALQNFFHFDSCDLFEEQPIHKILYHLNAILPLDIVARNIQEVADEAHCRFDALSRTYEYRIYKDKNPFISEQAYFYPYGLDLEALNTAAKEIMQHTDFEAFSKHSTQVHTYQCSLLYSHWISEADSIKYRVRANRFLRGMVRGLVGTMLQVGRGKISANDFHEIIIAKKSARVNFAVPAHGLSLIEVMYPESCGRSNQ